MKWVIFLFICFSFFISSCSNQITEPTKSENNLTLFKKPVLWQTLYEATNPVTGQPEIWCLPPAGNCMEAVIVYGDNYNAFISLFEEDENGNSILTSETTADYFNAQETPTSWSSFLDFTDHTDYLNLLQSGEVYILQTYQENTGFYVYLIIDNDISVDNALENIIFAIEIETET
jgi:hypothetical protein